MYVIVLALLNLGVNGGLFLEINVVVLGLMNLEVNVGLFFGIDAWFWIS